jgi:hypothetical protein
MARHNKADAVKISIIDEKFLDTFSAILDKAEEKFGIADMAIAARFENDRFKLSAADVKTHAAVWKYIQIEVTNANYAWSTTSYQSIKSLLDPNRDEKMNRSIVRLDGDQYDSLIE